jgi:hypothetical protein
MKIGPIGFLSSPLSDDDRLDWILDFIQKELSLKELNKLEQLQLCMGYLSAMQDKSFSTDIDWSTAIKLQDEIIKRVTRGHDILRKLFLNEVVPIFFHGEKRTIQRGISIIRLMTIEPHRLSLTIKSTGDGDDAVWNFLELFSSVGRDRVCQCKNCNKYFLNRRQTKKRFCSPQCNWRYNSRLRRESAASKAPKLETKADKPATGARVSKPRRPKGKGGQDGAAS